MVEVGRRGEVASPPRPIVGIRLGQAISHVWGWAGEVDCWVVPRSFFLEKEIIYSIYMVH